MAPLPALLLRSLVARAARAPLFARALALASLIALGLGSATPAAAKDPPPLDAIVREHEQAKGRPFAERYAILERAGEHAGDERAARFVEGVYRTDADAGMRRAALSLLGRIGGPYAEATLGREAREAKDPNERAAALDALGRLRPLPERGVFRAACAASEPLEVRRAGARGLAAYADAEAAKELVGLLVPPRPDGAESPGGDLNKTVLDLLRAMPGAVAGEAAAGLVLRQPRGRALWLKGALLPIAAASGALAADPALALALTHEPDAGARALAAHTLARVPQTAAVTERLIDLLKDKDDGVAAGAAAALGEHAPAAALEPLIKAAEKPGPIRMGAAAAALGGYAGSDAAWAALAKIARKKKPWQAVAGALAALERFRERRTIELLMDLLDKLDGRLHQDAHRALVGLSGVEIGPEAEDWREWWRAVGDHFEVPPKGARAKASGRGSTVSRNPTFYGQEVVSRRVCFIVDLSGSMSAEMRVDDGPPATRLEVAKRELKGVIDGLAADAWFNVVFFGSEFRSWRPTITAGTPAARKDAQATIDAASFMGATNIFDPLEATLADPNVDTIYLLSDGGPTAGKIVERDAILAEIRRLNQGRRIAIHTISVGEKSAFMRRLAQENGGVYAER